MAAIERLRAGHPSVAIFAIAATAEPDLILQAMRAGANEFFPWNPGGGTQASRAMEESFHGAVRRTAARREAATRRRAAALRHPCVPRRERRRRHDDRLGELRRRARPPDETADRDHRPEAVLGEVALFLGVRPRFTVLDAIENLHRLDRDFLRELMARHKSGLDILAGSEQFDRPNAQDAGAIEELLRVSRELYDYIVIDAGNMINACAVAALYAADTIFLVTNPDVPSIRNAQRLVDRVRQLGAGSERVKMLLNRVSDQHLIAPKQIETALGSASTTRSRATTGRCRRRSTRACRWRCEPFGARVAVRQLHPPPAGLVDEAKAEPERRKAFLGSSNPESTHVRVPQHPAVSRKRPAARPRPEAPRPQYWN